MIFAHAKTGLVQKSTTTLEAWSSLVKEESLACQITFPFNNKLGCF